MIQLKWSCLKENRWYEYLVRFGLGGAATVVTGIIAKAYGPETGGLFLAFPAIFSASATLVEAHERRRKKRKGMEGARRGQEAAAVDAAGAALGSFGLAAFGAVIWLCGPVLGWPALALALLAWAVICFCLWWVWFRQRGQS